MRVTLFAMKKPGLIPPPPSLSMFVVIIIIQVYTCPCVRVSLDRKPQDSLLPRLHLPIYQVKWEENMVHVYLGTHDMMSGGRDHYWLGCRVNLNLVGYNLAYG